MNVPKSVIVGAIVAAALVMPGRAYAQIDFNGVWAPIFHEDQPERVPGPDIGDYAGLPINDAARMKADTWDASILTLPEHQCKPHPSTYGFRGVGNLRIAFDFDDATQRLVKISAETSGRVVNLAVNEGDRIKKGQFLLQIDPKSLSTRVASGNASLQAAEQSLSALRNKVHRFRGIPLIVTYHPAALLRNPHWKRPTWDDVRIAARLLDS